jgi:hypothetical protein
MYEERKTITTNMNLIQLSEFINSKKELFTNIDTNFIQKYIDFAKKYNGHYYVGGQVKLSPADFITMEHINQAKKINETAVIGHQMDYYALEISKKELTDLEKIWNVIDKMKNI